MRIVKLACIIGVTVMGSACASLTVAARPSVRLRAASPVELRAALDPYGEWVVVGTYGRVWRPLGMPSGWQPYTYGTWTYIDANWEWRSDFDWGWAAFHYGRWYFDGAYGWVWVPGDVWGPGWVAWHRTGVHVGWAPLGPRGYRAPRDGWCFVEQQHFGRRHVRRVMVRRAERDRLLHARAVDRAPARPSRARHERRAEPAGPAPRATPARMGTPARKARPAVPPSHGFSAGRGSRPSQASAPAVHRSPKAKVAPRRAPKLRVPKAKSAGKASSSKARPAKRTAKKAKKRHRD